MEPICAGIDALGAEFHNREIAILSHKFKMHVICDKDYDFSKLTKNQQIFLVKP